MKKILAILAIVSVLFAEAGCQITGEKEGPVETETFSEEGSILSTYGFVEQTADEWAELIDRYQENAL